MCALHNAGGPGLSGRPDADFRAGVNFAFTLYPSLTEGLRLIDTEQWGRVYSVGGPGSTAVFLSFGVRSLAAGRFHFAARHISVRRIEIIVCADLDPSAGNRDSERGFITRLRGL